MAENGTDSGKLSPAQRRAIGALLVERDNRSAAASARVAERTLYKWLKDDTFARALQDAQAALIANTLRRLTTATGKAVDVLNDAMTGADHPIMVKVRAADVTLQRLLHLKEIVELEQRIAILEAHLDANKASV